MTLADLSHAKWTTVAFQRVLGEWDWLLSNRDVYALTLVRDDGRIVTAQVRKPDGFELRARMVRR